MSVGDILYLGLVALLIGGGLLVFVFRERLQARMERNVLRRQQELSDAGVQISSPYHPDAGVPPANAGGLLMIVTGLLFLAMYLLKE